MKKTCLFGLLVLCIVVLTAPLAAFEKGTKGIGGSLAFSGTKYEKGDPTSYSLTINPQVSLFIVDNLSLDLDLGLGLGWSSGESAMPSYGIGIGGRYFIKRFYGGAGIFFNGYRMNSYIMEYDDEGFPIRWVKDGTQWRRETNLILKLGHLFPIAKNVYLDAGLSYRIGLGDITFSKETDFKNDVNILTTRVGLAYYF